MDLFSYRNKKAGNQIASTVSSASSQAPLADRLRPSHFTEFVGQKDLFKNNSTLLRRLETGHLQSLILWGPPGTGKTSFARAILSAASGERFEENAIDLGVKRIRELGLSGRRKKIEFQTSSVLFIDEIHRLNKSQQDVLLPFIEKGELYLVGATSENPSYQLNSALMSRCRLLVFEPLNGEDLKQLLLQACKVEQQNLEDLLSPDAQGLLIESSQGDARRLLNQLEEVFLFKKLNTEVSYPISKQDLVQVLGEWALRYDAVADEHFDCISAFIKSVRGSDPDAAIYYLARMLEGGEDPLFIARRLVVLASEDISNADPQALQVAINVFKAVEIIGLPEAAINLAQGVTYLASAPKSNRSYVALNKARESVRATGPVPIPKSLRSAKTAEMKKIGYGAGYRYSHDGPKGFLQQTFLPTEIAHQKFYEPSERGFEKRIKEYIEWMKK